MNARSLFWRLPTRLQLQIVKALVWRDAHTPHAHHWVGSQGWSHATGWVQYDDYCSICFKRRERP